MKKELSRFQWYALVLLTVGCISSQLSSVYDDRERFSISFRGFFVCLLIAFTSASAGVSTEWIMKKSSMKSEPLQLQNLYMYMFGIIFNGIAFWLEYSPGNSISYGFQYSTALIIASYAFVGLTVSLIIKHADNIVKTFAVAISKELTMLLSIAFFDFRPTAQLFLGMITVTISILTYFTLASVPSKFNCQCIFNLKNGPRQEMGDKEESEFPVQTFSTNDNDLLCNERACNDINITDKDNSIGIDGIGSCINRKISSPQWTVAGVSSGASVVDCVPFTLSPDIRLDFENDFTKER